MARRRSPSRSASPSTQQTWKVQRPRLTADELAQQTKYRPKTCRHCGSDRGEWCYEPDLSEPELLAFYHSCGCYTLITPQGASDEAD